MKLQEHQAKMLLVRYGVHVPLGRLARTPDEARRNAGESNAKRFAVKAQIPAGGRGRAKGVALVSSPDEAAAFASGVIGKTLVTEQTGPSGYKVSQVLVEEAIPARRSFYVALIVDASQAGIVILASTEAGEDIEERLHAGKTDIQRLAVGSGGALDAMEATGLAQNLGLEDELVPAFVRLLGQLRTAFIENDATLIELNPLAVSEEGTFVALDAKIEIDDNALFRHPDMIAWDDGQQEDDIEVVAQSRQLNYVRMDGDIGVVANGAGLGLATLDMVRAANGRPANFMDIRTTATSLDVAHGFTLLLDNPAVRSILVNVHGGGMQPCDIIADGLGIAMRRTGRSRPTVVRLAGNSAGYARFRFKNFGCEVIDCPDMWAAATSAVAAAQSAGEGS